MPAVPAKTDLILQECTVSDEVLTVLVDKMRLSKDKGICTFIKYTNATIIFGT